VSVPFHDGNGRVSRLLLLLSCYHAGVEVGRYISLERMIEDNKERYYETLELSSEGWHEGTHDPWHYIGFVLYILKSAYREFEERLGHMLLPRGAKKEMVEHAVLGFSSEFSVRDVQAACPSASIDLVRKTLKEMRREGVVECLGRGRIARWRRIGY
jgi:Fic family protein